MNVLILGGTGFLSKAFLTELSKEKGCAVDTVTRNGVGNNNVRNDFQVDRLNLLQVKNILSGKRYDYVFDFSSYSFCDVKTIIENLNRKQLRAYVYCSSISVYAKTDTLIRETSPCDATLFGGQYGKNKLSCERYILQKHEETKFPYIILRPTYIYGPSNRLHREKYYFDRALKNQTIYLPQNDVRFQFIYLTDLVKLLLMVFDAPAMVNHIYNCASEERLSLKQLVNEICNITHAKSEICYYDEQKTHEKVSSFRIIPYHYQSFEVSTEELNKAALFCPKTRLSKGLMSVFQEIKEEGIKTSQPLLTSVDHFVKKGYIIPSQDKTLLKI